MTAEGPSDKMVSDKMESDMEVRVKQRCVNSSVRKKIAINDIHRRLLNLYGDQTLDVVPINRIFRTKQIKILILVYKQAIKKLNS